MGFYEGGFIYPNSVSWLDKTVVNLSDGLSIYLASGKDKVGLVAPHEDLLSLLPCQSGEVVHHQEQQSKKKKQQLNKSEVEEEMKTDDALAKVQSVPENEPRSELRLRKYWSKNRLVRVVSPPTFVCKKMKRGIGIKKVVL